MSLQERIDLHQLGQLHFNEGNYDKAMAAFSQAERHGSNIHLEIDIASLYYVKGDVLNWHKATKRVEDSLLRHQEILSEKSVARTKVFLAKYQETRGEICGARDVYRSLLNRGTPMVLAQLVRLQGQWGPKAGLPEIYRRLTQLRQEMYSEFINIEVEHALALAESYLFGIDKALERFHFLNGKFKLNAADERLVLSDLLENLLFKKLAVPAELINLLKTVPGLSRYEHALIAISENKAVSTVELAKSTSGAGYLRLLSLLINSGSHQLRDEYLFRLEDLSTASKKLWLEQIQEQAGIGTLLFDAQRHLLILGNRTLSLRRRKVFCDLLSTLIADSSLSTSDADESTRLRMRVSVHRFNQLVASELGIKSLIDFRDNEVKLLAPVTAV